MSFICVTQEPHGSYHLAPLTGIELVHLQPAPVTPHPDVAVTDDSDMIESATALIVSGGLVTEFTDAAMVQASAAGVPIVFVELAYPSGHEPVPPSVTPDAVIATSDAGQRVLEQLFSISALRAAHPTLANLPTHRPAPTPRLLIGSSASAEMPDDGERLRDMARLLEASGWLVTVRLHPREDAERWTGFTIDPAGTLAEALTPAWAFLAYQTTAFLTSNAMGVPSYHLAEAPWMSSLTPDGYAHSAPVSEPADVRQRRPSTFLTDSPASVGAAEMIGTMFL